MTEIETKRQQNRWYEYKVEATVEYDAGEESITDTALYDMHSAWISDKSMAVNLAESLRDAGHAVEIRTRQRGSYAPKDFDAIPKRGETPRLTGNAYDDMGDGDGR